MSNQGDDSMNIDTEAIVVPKDKGKERAEDACDDTNSMSIDSMPAVVVVEKGKGRVAEVPIDSLDEDAEADEDFSAIVTYKLDHTQALEDVFIPATSSQRGDSSGQSGPPSSAPSDSEVIDVDQDMSFASEEATVAPSQPPVLQTRARDRGTGEYLVCLSRSLCPY